MIIVGLTGGIGHGKTTLAEYLAKCARQHQHWETSDLIIEVANTLRYENSSHPPVDNIAAINSWLAPLAAIVMACVHCHMDFTQLALTEERLKASPELYAKLFEYLQLMQDQPELQTVEITTDNKRLFRSLLQWLGGFLAKTVSAGIWFDELVRRINMPGSNGVMLVTVGGVRFPDDAERLRNAGGFIIAIERPGQTAIDIQDVTERERELIKPDSQVINNGTLKDLQHSAERLYADLKTRNLQTSYRAVTG